MDVKWLILYVLEVESQETGGPGRLKSPGKSSLVPWILWMGSRSLEESVQLKAAQLESDRSLTANTVCF